MSELSNRSEGSDAQIFLGRLSQTLRTLIIRTEIETTACDALRVHLRSDGVVYRELPDRASDVPPDAASGTTTAAGPRVAHTPDTELRLLRDLVQGAPIAVVDVSSAPQLSDDERDEYTAHGIRALVAAGVTQHDRLLAALFVHQHAPRRWAASELLVVQEVADRIWTAVARSREEAALRAQITELRAIVDRVSESCTFTIDRAGTVTSWSFSAERLTRWRADEIVGRPCAWLESPQHTDATSMSELLAHVLRERWAEHSSWFRRGDGSSFRGRYVLTALRPDPLGGEVITVTLTRLGDPPHAPAPGGDASDMLASDLHRQRIALAQAYLSLHEEVRERRTAEQQVQTLVARLMHAQEEERRRLARDFHDQLGQQLTALRLHLASMSEHASRLTPLAEIVAQTVKIAGDIDHSVAGLRWQLRPPLLDRAGLREALRALVQDWSNHAGVHAQFGTTGPEDWPLARETETNLFRVVQEALHNVHKHAGATEVTVLVHRLVDALVLVIEDNGAGFDPEKVAPQTGSSGLGLRSMRERVALAGGEFDIESSPRGGASIFVRVPLPAGSGARSRHAPPQS